MLKEIDENDELSDIKKNYSTFQQISIPNSIWKTHIDVSGLVKLYAGQTNNSAQHNSDITALGYPFSKAVELFELITRLRFTSPIVSIQRTNTGVSLSQVIPINKTENADFRCQEDLCFFSVTTGFSYEKIWTLDPDI